MAWNPVTLTGTVKDASNNPVSASGYIWFTISQNGNSTSGGFQIARSSASVFAMTNGVIAANSFITANDDISPAGTFYIEEVIGADGGLIVRRNVTINGPGTSVDIGTLASPALPASALPTDGTVTATTGILTGTQTASRFIGPATGLRSATTDVTVSGSAAPNPGDVLTATSSTVAAWAAPGTIPGSPFVSLQATTPGTYQSGNLNIVGTAIVGQLVTTGPISGIAGPVDPGGDFSNSLASSQPAIMGTSINAGGTIFQGYNHLSQKKFEIGEDGNLSMIRGTSYTWPTANAAGALMNDGAGALSFTALGTPPFVSTSRAINTTAPLAGGGALTADRTLTISIDTTNDGGAIAKQASTPGVAQTGYINITGTMKAAAVEGAGTGDLVLRGQNADGSAVRIGSSLGTTPRQSRFYGPVYIDKTVSGTSTGLQNSDNVGDILHIIAKVDSAATLVGTYSGIGITNDTATGNDLAMNTYYHAITVNIASNTTAGNQVSGIETFISTFGANDVFGGSLSPSVAPTASGNPANMVGLGTRLAWNRKTANTGAGYGVLLSQDSTGKPISGGGYAWGFFAQRNRALDYLTGTVSGTSGTPNLTGTGTTWTQVGPSPYYNLVGKKLAVGGNVYEISSVTDDTHLVLTTNLLTSPSTAAYRIRCAEPFDKDIYVRDAYNTGLEIDADQFFPAPLTNTILCVKNAANNNILALNYGGQLSLGTLNSNALITVNTTFAGTTNAVGIRFDARLIPTTGNDIYGINSFPTAGNSTENITNATSIVAGAVIKGNSGTITNAIGLKVEAQAATCTNAYGILVDAPSGGSAVNLAASFGGAISTRSSGVTLSNGANQNVNIGASGNIRITGPTAVFSIGGLTGGADGRDLYVFNVSGFNLTFNNQDAGSTAANRILTIPGTNVTLGGTNFQYAHLKYDSISGFWWLLDHS